MTDASREIHGACHCGNLSFVIHTRMPLENIRARACDCSFCCIHAARNWSDPDGTAVIRVNDAGHLHKYRFALRTADFYICTTCGTYLGAVLSDERGAWSTLNLRLAKISVEEEIASYGSENADDRIDRRKRDWTPTEIHLGAAG
ncbi:MAG: hypothetical protein WCB49_13450 [Gammaproteobacteria bacterium]